MSPCAVQKLLSSPISLMHVAFGMMPTSRACCYLPHHAHGVHPCSVAQGPIVWAPHVLQA